MKDVIILVLLIGIIGWAAWRTVRKFRKGGGCCGGHEALPKKTAVRDRNQAHYPYEVTLEIGGMTCENCARRVENALNQLEGVWAAVRINSRCAIVRLKQTPSESELRRAVRDAGYTVTGYCRKK